MNTGQGAQIEEVLAQPQADLIEITFYTDPLCCWSWAFEPQWKKFQYLYQDRIKVKTVMGGLIKDWNSFNDPLNSVHRPVQMGPMWMQARNLSGMPVEDIVWLNDPPASSYISCIAVKTAGLQSLEAEQIFLRKLREKVMIFGKNIAKREVITEVAQKTSNEFPEIFDDELFLNQFLSAESKEAFKLDLEKVRFHQITRFPTLTIQKKGSKGVIITGYRPYEVLVDALKAVEPSIAPCIELPDREKYSQHWKSITERELKEIM